MASESISDSIFSSMQDSHAMDGNSPSHSTTGISSFEVDRTIADKFEGTLYHVLPSQLKVVIKFCIPTLFKDFIGMLGNEFDNSSWSIESTFTVSSHIQGKKVSIKVIEAEKAVEVSGPGHKLWKDITIKRIATTLFGRFLQNFSVDLQSSIINTNTQPQMTSTPMVTRPNVTSVPATPPAETFRHQGTPMEGHMAVILELLAYHSKMITTLQEQLTSLTEEVVKLQEKTPGRKASTEENPPPVRAKTKPGRKASTEKNPSPVRARTISVSSIESELSDQRINSDLIHNEDNEQTPSLPKSTPLPKRLNDKNQPNKTQKKNTKQTKNKTLIIGDSIIKGINAKGLTDYVHCNGISSATIETVTDQISVYDLKNFDTVILSVGGNDVSNGAEIEWAEDNYDKLIQFIKNANSLITIILCTACPRRDCDVTELNDIIKSLSVEHRTKIVEMDKYFCNTDGNPVFRYYDKDRIHLSHAGIRRLLDSIEKSCDTVTLVDDFQRCVYGRPSGKHRGHNQNRDQQNKGQRAHRPQGNTRQPNSRKRLTHRSCAKCGESNHATFECRHKTQIKCHLCGLLGHKQSKCPSA